MTFSRIIHFLEENKENSTKSKKKHLLKNNITPLKKIYK